MSWASASAALELWAGGASPQVRARGLPSVGRRPDGPARKGHPLTVKSCPCAMPFPSMLRGTGRAPRPCSAPLGAAVTDGSGAVLCLPCPLGPASRWGDHRRAPPAGASGNHPLGFSASPWTWSLAVAKEKSGFEVLSSSGGWHAPMTLTFVSSKAKPYLRTAARCPVGVV